MADKKVVLNQKAIDAAKKKNTEAETKAAAARAKIDELKPRVAPAQTLLERTASGNKLVEKINKKVLRNADENTAARIQQGKELVKKGEERVAKVKSEVLDPFSAAEDELKATDKSMVEVPEAEYPSLESQSAYDLVTAELTRLGLSSLVGPLREIFESGITGGDSLRLALSQRPEYQTRFSANAKRLAAGLSALSPAEYIQLEDQYQNVMRNYGLPASYYAKDATGKQIGFDELLGGDVSATELEERLITAQDRVLKSNPEVLDALKKFYPGIEKGDILAYSLDPKNALKDIQRKVAAAEIGGAALAQGLSTTMAGSEELAGYGVTKAQAQQGFADVAQMSPRGGVLSDIYNEAPYNQATATAEVFGTAGAAEAAQKRRKLTGLEQATFGGQSGLSQGALARNSGAGGY
jgi:hypothetical protein